MERGVDRAAAPGEEFHGWLSEVVRREASDLHLTVGTPGKLGETRRLVPLDRDALTPAETAAIANAIVPPDGVERFEPRARSTSRTPSRTSGGSA